MFTSWKWDKIVRKAINTGDFKIINEFRAKVGGIDLWISNYPYSYGNYADNRSNDKEILSSRRTCLLLLKMKLDKLKKPAKSRIDELVEMFGDKSV